MATQPLTGAAGTESKAGGLSSKGLTVGKVGVIGGAVIGISCVAPAYTLTSGLGPAIAEVGYQMPAILLIGFIPMLLVVFGYRELNNAMPDSGTTFTWATRAFGPWIGWMGGWGLIAATILVLSNLAAIAVDFVFVLISQISGNPEIADLTLNPWINIPMTALFVAIAAAISYRGVEATQKVQFGLVGFQVLALGWFVIAAFINVANGTAYEGTPVSLEWFNPAAVDSFGALTAGISLSIFLFWGWDVVLTMNEEAKDPEKTPGRASVLTIVVIMALYMFITLAVLSFAGVGDGELNANNPDIADTLFSSLSGPIMGPFAILVTLAVLTSSAASLQSTMVSPSRTFLAMGHYGAMPKSFANVSPRFKSPSVATIVSAVATIAFYVVLRIFSENALWDTIAALGLMVCFYYGITGLACVWYFRHTAFENARSFFFKFLFPLLGGATLLVMFFTTSINYAAPDAGSGSALFATTYEEIDGVMVAQDGVGLVFVLGIGVLLLGVVIMVIQSIRNPAFFRGETIQTGNDRDTRAIQVQQGAESTGV